jgi:outer membrane protein assembly factor BamB
LPEDPYRSYLANHGYASSTPISDGSSVFVYFGKSGVFAFDLEGKPLWHKSVGTEKHPWGSGSSPILYKDLLIINAAVESGALIALHKKDGSVAWQLPDLDYSWTTPCLVSLKSGRQELVVSNRNQMLGVDPDKGTLLWECKGIQDYVCPSVIAHDDVVYVIGARQNAALAIRAGGKGDVTKSHLLWEIHKGSNVCTPVYYEGHLYWGKDNDGMIYCVRADTGKVMFEERVKESEAQFYASPIVADGKIYFASREHGTYVLAAEPKYRLLAHNTLADPTYFNGTPAISEGRVYLRSDRWLFCLGK